MKLLKYHKNLIIRTATSYYRIQFYATNVVESTSETVAFMHIKRERRV